MERPPRASAISNATVRIELTTTSGGAATAIMVRVRSSLGCQLYRVASRNLTGFSHDTSTNINSPRWVL